MLFFKEREAERWADCQGAEVVQVRHQLSGLWGYCDRDTQLEQGPASLPDGPGDLNSVGLGRRRRGELLWGVFFSCGKPSLCEKAGNYGDLGINLRCPLDIGICAEYPRDIRLPTGHLIASCPHSSPLLSPGEAYSLKEFHFWSEGNWKRYSGYFLQNSYWNCNYDPSCPSIGRSVGLFP